MLSALTEESRLEGAKRGREIRERRVGEARTNRMVLGRISVGCNTTMEQGRKGKEGEREEGKDGGGRKRRKFQQKN